MSVERLLVHRGTFASTSLSGDITGRRGDTPDGLFLRDARHLSRWRLTADGVEPSLLTSSDDGFVLTPEGGRDEPPAYSLFRTQAVEAGTLTEHVRVVSNRAEPATVEIALEVDADFADQFELRGDHRRYDKADGRRTAEDRADGVAFRYRRGEDWDAGTTVTASPAPAAVRPLEPAGIARLLTWRLPLPGHGAAELALSVRAVPPAQRNRPRPRTRCRCATGTPPRRTPSSRRARGRVRSPTGTSSRAPARRAWPTWLGCACRRRARRARRCWCPRPASPGSSPCSAATPC